MKTILMQFIRSHYYIKNPSQKIGFDLWEVYQAFHVMSPQNLIFFFFFILMYASLKQYILKQTATSKNCLGYIERLKGF